MCLSILVYRSILSVRYTITLLLHVTFSIVLYITVMLYILFRNEIKETFSQKKINLNSMDFSSKKTTKNFFIILTTFIQQIGAVYNYYVLTKSCFRKFILMCFVLPSHWVCDVSFKTSPCKFAMYDLTLCCNRNSLKQ